MFRFIAQFLRVISLRGCSPDNSPGVDKQKPFSATKEKELTLSKKSAVTKRVVTLTPAAVKMVYTLRTQHPHKYFRVGVDPDAWSYNLGLDNKTDSEKDFIDVFEGLSIVVDRISEPYLNGTTIDFEDTEEGRGFRFHNPNAEDR